MLDNGALLKKKDELEGLANEPDTLMNKADVRLKAINHAKDELGQFCQVRCFSFAFNQGTQRT